MERAYERFRGRRHSRRIAFVSYVAVLFILVLVGIYASYNAQWVTSFFVPIIVVVFLIGMLYLVSRPWASESFETDIFVSIYDTFKLLELVSDEDETSFSYLKKAAKKLEDAISSIETLEQRLTATHSTLVKKRLVEPLTKLQKNLETLILPRVAEKKYFREMISVLHGLAQLFSETTKPLSLEDIISKNEDLECFKPIETKRKPSRMRIMFSTEPMRFSFSIGLGFVVVSVIVILHSMLYRYNLFESLRDLTSFLEVVVGSIALGVAIYEIRKRR